MMVLLLELLRPKPAKPKVEPSGLLESVHPLLRGAMGDEADAVKTFADATFDKQLSLYNSVPKSLSRQ